MTVATKTEIIEAETVAAQPPAVIDQQQAMLSMIERVALNPEVPIERMMQLLEMKERIDSAQARKAFDLAISQAKAEIPPIVKSRTVDFTSQKGRTHYKHEDLAGIAEVVDPILGRYGLSYRYRTHQDGTKVSVTCVLSHRDGYSEETTLTGGHDQSGNKNDFQAVGSAVTYLQRYTLKAALGLAAAHDDDSGKAAPKDAGTISPDQFRALRDLLEQSGSDEARFLRFFKIEMLEEMPIARFGEADKMLRQKIAEKGAGA